MKIDSVKRIFDTNVDMGPSMGIPISLTKKLPLKLIILLLALTANEAEMKARMQLTYCLRKALDVYL